MRVTYGATIDAAYVGLVDEVRSVEQQEAAPGMVLDFDAEGNVIGIEIYSEARARIDLRRLVTTGFDFEEVRREGWKW